MYKQGKRGNILYSAVGGGGSFYNGYNILTPPPLPYPTTTNNNNNNDFIYRGSPVGFTSNLPWGPL